MPLVLFLVLLFGPLLGLVVRRRWVLLVARQEEVRRLVLLASEEAARAQLECSAGTPAAAAAAAACDDVSVESSQRQCAVCYSPTTTRCSRCKAVRYCSGKCQIVHWRQGHKEECHPPPVDHCNGKVKVTCPDRVQGERGESSDGSWGTEKEIYAKPVEALLKRSTPTESNYSSEFFSEDDTHDDKPFVNTSGTESSSDSSSWSTFSGPVEPSDDALGSEDLTRASAGQFGSVRSSDISRNGLSESMSVHSFPDMPEGPESDEGFTKLTPSVFNFESMSVNNAFCSTNHKPYVSACKNEEVDAPGTVSSGSDTNSGPSTECQVESVDFSAVQTADTNIFIDSQNCLKDDKCTQQDAGSPWDNSPEMLAYVKPFLSNYNDGNSSSGTALSKGAKKLESGFVTVLGIKKSGHVASERADNALLESKESRCVSSACPLDHLSSSDRVYSVPSDTSSKVDNSAKVSTGLSKSINSVPNSTSDMEKSVGRVIHQIKSSESSRHCSSGITYYASKKYKMLFPYDLFVKLYNSDKVERRPCGLTNCSNSCYANAVLQCLAVTRPLAAYLMEGLHTKTGPKQDWCFTCELESLLVKAKQGKSPLSPIGIISHIKKFGKKFSHGREEDAHEFLRYAVDAMQSACLKEAGPDVIDPMAKETTLVQLIFGGYLHSKIRCMRCLCKSERFERILDLTVEINGDVGTLEQALAHFTATEILDGENKYLCNRCKSYERAEKKLTILEAPNVLTIALKRYQSGKFGKINKAIQFPECLNLAPYMRGTEDKSPVYCLYALVVHLDIKNAAFSGHYICYVKNTRGKWYEIDDSVVKPVELQRVLKQGAYMLLYERCSPRAPSLLSKATSQDQGNIKHGMNEEAVRSCHGRNSHASRARSIPVSSPSTSPSNFEPCVLFDKRVHNSRANSCTDISSLLSCSDEGSLSTKSARESFSTSEYSECLSGEPDHQNSPLRFSEDSDGSTYSCLNPRHSNSFSSNSSACRDYSLNDTSCNGEKSPSIVCSDRTDQCRKLTEEFSSREADRTDPCNKKLKKVSSLLKRFSKKERATQKFY